MSLQQPRTLSPLLRALRAPSTLPTPSPRTLFPTFPRFVASASLRPFSTSPPPSRPATSLGTLLRSAFSRPAAAATPATPLARYFSSAAARSGPRPYYGSGGGGGRGSRSNGGFKQRIDALPESYILYGIIGLNAAVFFAWQYGQSLLQQFRDISWLKFLNQHFTCSWQNIQSGRLWTLVTCCFSHEGTGHIIMNLASLYFMAPPVIMMLGNTGFLALYLFAGVTSSVVSLIFSKFVGSNKFYQSHGASGAIYGTIAFFAAAYPRTTFLLFFVVPVPAWLCVGGILAWDTYSSFFRRSGTTDSAGHVGGALAGLFWAARKLVRF